MSFKHGEVLYNNSFYLSLTFADHLTFVGHHSHKTCHFHIVIIQLCGDTCHYTLEQLVLISSLWGFICPSTLSFYFEAIHIFLLPLQLLSPTMGTLQIWSAHSLGIISPSSPFKGYIIFLWQFQLPTSYSPSLRRLHQFSTGTT